MQLGNYTIERELARGGMGAVFVASDPAGRRVAVKLLLARNDPQERERFRREAESLGRIEHPNVVGVHGFGQDAQGRDYLVLTLVEGESLDARLKREGPLEPREAAQLARTIADALEAAHQQGVLHRDMKPANILIRAEDGAPVVTDFGLARVTDQSRALTQTGTMHGTPAYMPPEQAAGELHNLGPHSDVYGLGALLFAMLTGGPPFSGNSPINILKSVLDDEAPTVSSVREGVPWGLEAITARCLAKHRLKRYASAAALREKLDLFLAGKDPEPRPKSRTSPWVCAGAAASLIILGIIGISASVGLNEPLPQPVEEAAKPTASREAEPIARAFDHAPSPDGRPAVEVGVQFLSDTELLTWGWHGRGSTLRRGPFAGRPTQEWFLPRERVYQVAVGGERVVLLVGPPHRKPRDIPCARGKRVVLLGGAVLKELPASKKTIFSAIALDRTSGRLAVAVHAKRRKRVKGELVEVEVPWIERYDWDGDRLGEPTKLTGPSKNPHATYIHQIAFGAKGDLFSVSGTGTSGALGLQKNRVVIHAEDGAAIGPDTNAAMIQVVDADASRYVFGDTVQRVCLKPLPWRDGQPMVLKVSSLKSVFRIPGPVSAPGSIDQLDLRGPRLFVRSWIRGSSDPDTSELRIWNLEAEPPSFVGGVTRFPNFYRFSVSPDGKWIALGLREPYEKKRYEIWRVEWIAAKLRERRELIEELKRER